MEAITVNDIPWHANGVMNLGPSNGSAITRMAYYAVALLQSGKPIPDSPFAEWAAGRICGVDKQDLVMFLAGRRGHGKSYSSMWIAVRVAQQIAKLVGGRWQDYFNMNNVATLENTDRVMEILNNAGMHNVVIIDDASLAVNNRNWASVPSKNFVALLTICRDRRWCLIFTAPLKKMADNQVRDMVDLTATIYKPYHADVNGRGGFNILKVVSSDISTSGKEYTKKMHFGKKKIDFWVTFRPDVEIIAEYDKRRAEGRQKVTDNIIEHGTYQISKPKEKKPRANAAEENTKEYVKINGERLAHLVTSEPELSMNQISIRMGASPLTVSRAMSMMGLSTDRKRKKKVVADGS